jgi:uncharacterized membrane protein
MRTDTILTAPSTSSRPLATLADRLMPTLTTAATVCCGVIAGVLFIFSVCIMPTLQARPAAEAIATMQSINVTIVNPLFMLAFMGGTLLCGLLAVASLVSRGEGGWWRFAGAALFVVGVFFVTGAANVPLNDQLASVDPHSAHGVSVWQHYLTAWTAWNHVRTIAAVASTAILAVASRLN